LAAAIRKPVYDLLAEREESERLEAERKAREAWAREQARRASIEAQMAAVAAIVDSLDMGELGVVEQNNIEE
jgi:hypothetical protein